MTRILLQYILPLILPMILYSVYITIARRKNPENPMSFFDGPWVAAVILGLLLMIGGLVAVALLDTKGNPGEVYQPPRMEDGRVVPGGFN